MSEGQRHKKGVQECEPVVCFLMEHMCFWRRWTRSRMWVDQGSEVGNDREGSRGNRLLSNGLPSFTCNAWGDP